VQVGDCVQRQLVQGDQRVQTQVDLVGVQVGQVQQQPDPGALDEFGQELASLIWSSGQPKRGHVLQRQRHRERGLGGADVGYQYL
jgi:hypothetical protein